MDWIVKIKTQSGYVKDVIVYDYNYPSDAVDAALAQTGADNYIYCSPYFDTEDRDTSGYQSSSSSSDGSYSTNPGAELEFIFWLCLGFIAILASHTPLAFVLFSIMTIRLCMSR
jgi:hypothetical protein